MRFLLLALALAGPAQAGIISGGGPTDSLSAATAAGTYVQKSGDTMTGRLTAPDATLTYGLTAATASFSGSVTASSVTSQGAFNAAGSTLTVGSNGIVSAPSQPAVVLEQTYSQVIPAGETPIYWGSATSLNQSMWVVTSSKTVSIPTGATGIYGISCRVEWNSATGNEHIVYIYKNGTSIAESHAYYGATVFTSAVSGYYPLTAGDSIECRVFTNTANNTVGAAGRNHFSVVKLW